MKQKPKSLEELAAQIEAENELFNSLSVEEKRVAIAKDALVRIDIGVIQPKTGWFISNMYELKRKGKDVKSVLNTCNDLVCECCAKGTMMLSLVGRMNNFTNSDFSDGNYTANKAYSSEHAKLQELFDIKQLDLIETAYEGKSYLEIISKEEVEKALVWKKKQKVGTERLLQRILRNIIKNKGTFVV